MIKRYSFIVAILLCVSTASAFSTELCDSLKRVEEKKVCVKLNGLVVIGIVNPLGGCGVKMNDVFVLSFRGDYVLHCLVYLPWMWVGSWMFGKRFRWWWWLGLGVIVVAGLEGVQMGLDYRSFNLNDLVAGEVGERMVRGEIGKL